MTSFHFLKVALRDYRVGALTVSSKYAVGKVLSQLKPEYRTVVEYGAGNGAITKKLLEKLPEDGELFAIEINRELLGELKKIRDPRLKVVEGDVSRISEDFSLFGAKRAQAVISGIPFSFFGRERRERIILNTYRHLVPGGRFIVYQYSLLVYPLLKKIFGFCPVYFEPRNLPPYFIMAAEKCEDGSEALRARTLTLK